MYPFTVSGVESRLHYFIIISGLSRIPISFHMFTSTIAFSNMLIAEIHVFLCNQCQEDINF